MDGEYHVGKEHDDLHFWKMQSYILLLLDVALKVALSIQVEDKTVAVLLIHELV